LDVAPNVSPVNHFAQENRPAVAQLCNEIAELVSGIGRTERLGTDRNAVTSKHLSQRVRIERR
jgi:hypothetical protein